MKTKLNWLLDRPCRSRKSRGMHKARRLRVEQLENRLLLTADFDWAIGIGSSGDDGVYGVSTDASGNAYVAGWFSGTVDFAPGADSHTLTSAGGTDSFAAKYSPGGALIWASRMGSSDNNYFDWASDIAVDGLGNVVVTGNFTGSAVFGSTTLVSVGGQDAFVTKLDGVTGNIVWAKRLGGSLTDRSMAVAVNAAGDIYVGGSGAFSLAKFDAIGTPVWVVGGPTPSSIAVDSSGNVYTTGQSGAGSVDFDPGDGTFILSSNSSFAFVQKLTSDGTFAWAKQFSVTSGKGGSGGNDIAVDIGGNVYVTGGFQGKVDFDPGTGSLMLTSASGSNDLFVSKLNSGGSLVWARMVGGTGTDGGVGIAVDGGNQVYLTGQFSGTVDFNPGAGVYILPSVGSYDVGVLKLDAVGNFAWAVRIGGSDQFRGRDIAVDPYGNVLVVGYYRGTADFNPGTGTYPLTSAGGNDSFILKLTQPVAVLATSSLSVSGSRYIQKSGTESQVTSLSKTQEQEKAKLIDAVYASSLDRLRRATLPDRDSLDLSDRDSLELIDWKSFDEFDWDSLELPS